MPFIFNSNNAPFPVPCRDAEHEPPSTIMLQDGTYTWECPNCKKVTHFIINSGIYC